MECQRGLAMRKVSICLSVCLYVHPPLCLSVKRVDSDNTEVMSLQIFILTKDHYLA